MTCTQMYIAALLLTAQTVNNQKGPSAGEWANKLVHPQRGKLLSNGKE